MRSARERWGEGDGEHMGKECWMKMYRGCQTLPCCWRRTPATPRQYTQRPSHPNAVSIYKNTSPTPETTHPTAVHPRSPLKVCCGSACRQKSEDLALQPFTPSSKSGHTRRAFLCVSVCPTLSPFSLCQIGREWIRFRDREPNSNSYSNSIF